MIWFLPAVAQTSDPVGFTATNSAVVQSLGLDLSQGPMNELCNETNAIANRCQLFWTKLKERSFHTDRSL